MDGPGAMVAGGMLYVTQDVLSLIGRNVLLAVGAE